MGYFITVLLIAVAALVLQFVLFRLYVLRKRNPKSQHNRFPGKLYRLDGQLVGKISGKKGTDTTIVCMPGFMEEISYFYELYKDRSEELIILNNFGYHSAYEESNAETVTSWFKKPSHHAGGTIEYDAMVVKQIVDNLVSHRKVVLHGHSRGGAVVLESLKLLNHRDFDVQVLLEAPVLPQGKWRGYQQAKWMAAIRRQMMPLMFNHYRENALKVLNSGGYKYPSTEVKKKIMSTLFSNPERYGTAVTNVDNIETWADGTDKNIYSLLPQVNILIPEKDSVLDIATMRASAESMDNIKIIDVPGANHFISIEMPDVIHREINALQQDHASSHRKI